MKTKPCPKCNTELPLLLKGKHQKIVYCSNTVCELSFLGIRLLEWNNPNHRKKYKKIFADYEEREE